MKGRKPIIVNNIQGISGRGKNSFHGAANKWQNKFMLLSRPNIDILVIFIFFHILSCLHVLHAIKSDVMNMWFFYATSWKIKWLNCEIQSSHFSEAFYTTITLNVKAKKVNNIQIICNWDLVWFPPNPSDRPNCQRPTALAIWNTMHFQLSLSLISLAFLWLQVCPSCSRLENCDDQMRLARLFMWVYHSAFRCLTPESVGYRTLTLTKLSNWVMM